MRDKDERGKALSVNVERGAGIFCKIVIVSFLSFRYGSDNLYYKMAGAPSSPTRFFLYSYSYITYTYTPIIDSVGDDGVSAIRQF